MTTTMSAPTEIVVRVIRVDSWASDTYLALIYSSSSVRHLTQEVQIPPNIPLMYSHRPLQGTGLLRIPVRYPVSHSSRITNAAIRDYYAAMGPQGDPHQMSFSLESYLSQGLQRFLRASQADAASLGIWWDCDLMEVEALPWELLFYGNWQGFFVRGSPPAGQSFVPPARLRLAIVGQRDAIRGSEQATNWDHVVWAPLRRLGAETQLELIPPSDGNPGVALRNAIEAGVELIHLVADGCVSPRDEQPAPLDGLALAGDPTQYLTALQLAALLEGSAVRALMLTTPHDMRDSDDPTDFTRLIWSYRGFVHLSHAAASLPSIVAPLSRADARPARRFWGTYYATLARTGDLIKAIVQSQRAARAPQPIALFLKHTSGPINYRPVENPARQNLDSWTRQIRAELQQQLQSASFDDDWLRSYATDRAKELSQSEAAPP